MGIALCEREKRVCIFEVGKEVDGEYSPFKLCVHKMQIISCLRMNAECKQGRVESPWSPGTPGSSRWLLLGEAGAPTWLPAFLFQSLWKLIVRSWESRSCHLEVYTAYAREALQTLQLYQLGAFASPSWKKKKALWSSAKCPRPAQPAQFCVVVWQPALLLSSFSWNAVLVENLGCLWLSKPLSGLS